MPRPRDGAGAAALARARPLAGAAALGLLQVLAGPALPANAETPELSLPIACTPGRDCWVQNLVDVVPGEGSGDFRCTDFTYDGHAGTDFRVANARRSEEGVAVLAAAPGRVARVRDGEPDRDFADGSGAAGPAGRECGNGVVIEHADGLETQYCHLKRGSVVVAPGEAVERGAPLGLVGASGRTAFVHLHFGVRVDGETVDPFTGRPAAAAGCGLAGTPMWEEPEPLAAAVEAQVVNAGFAAGSVAMEDIETGAVPVDALERDAAAVVFFGRAANLLPGDRQRIRLEGPGVSIDQTFAPLPRKRAQSMVFVGERAPAGGLAPGIYAGRYEVLRGEDVLRAASSSIVVE